MGAAVQFALAGRNGGGGSAFVVGSQALVDHVAEAGLRIVNGTPFAARADVVVVGGHDALVFEELKLATQAVLRGAELIGATRDAELPDAGRPVARHRRGAGRDRDRQRPPRRRRTVGKPEPPMYEAARDRLGPGRILAVGDRLDVDVGRRPARRDGLGARAHRRHVRAPRRSAADAAARRTSPTPWPRWSLG